MKPTNTLNISYYFYCDFTINLLLMFDSTAHKSTLIQDTVINHTKHGNNIPYFFIKQATAESTCTG